MNLSELKYKDLKAIGKAVGVSTGEKINMVGVSQPDLCTALKAAIEKHGLVAADVDDTLQATFQALVDGVEGEPAPAKEKPAPVEKPVPVEITDEQIIALAGEMNTVLGLSPALDVDLPIETLKEKIMTCAKQPDMIRPTDEFSVEAWATLRGMGAVAPLEPAKAPKNTKAKTERAPAAPKTPKAPAAPQYTRVTAAIDVLRAGTAKTYGELITKSDELYTKAFPDKSNVKEARFAMSYIKQVLVASGIASFEGRGDDAVIKLLADLPARPDNLPKY